MAEIESEQQGGAGVPRALDSSLTAPLLTIFVSLKGIHGLAKAVPVIIPAGN